MDKSPESQQENSLRSFSSVILLTANLKLDLDGAVLIREHEETLLTAREVGLLRILVHTTYTSRGYISSKSLARRLISSEAFDPEHCIEQTISVLRRKLGEPPRHPSILKGRRGLGYRLFLLQESG